MFNLAYFLHWSWAEMHEMSYDELMLFHALLQRQKEAEEAAARAK